MKKILRFTKRKITDLSKKSIIFRKSIRTLLLSYRKAVYLKYYFFNKVNDKTIIFEAYLGRSYACSPKAIYQAILKDPRYQNYNLIWAFKNPTEYLNNEELKFAKIITYKSKEYKKAYSQAKYWITNSRLPQHIIKKNNQVYIQCWHGTPLKRLGLDIVENTISTLNTNQELEKQYLKDARRYNYFLSPSKYASEKFISAFGLDRLKKQDIILELGYPRNDFLFKYNKVNQVKSINSLNLPKDKKVILYCPTFRDDQHKSGIGYTYDLEVNFDFLREKLGDEYIILFRAHYFVASIFDFAKYNNFIYNVSGVDDINDLYIISDILITDYSSVFFDYANLKRPIIFFMYDLEIYENLLRGFYLDLKELPGKIVMSEQEIINIIDNISDYQAEYHEKYLEFNTKFNYLDNSDVSESVIDIIL